MQTQLTPTNGKGFCDDCGNYSHKLSSYDDSFTNIETGGIEQGYFHDMQLCVKCTKRHDRKNEMIIDQVAKELQYIKSHREF